MKPFVWLIISFLILVSVSNVSYRKGWDDRTEAIFYSYSKVSDNLTREEIINKLAIARDNHQYYIDHPDKLDEHTGSVKDNIGWVKLYEQLLDMFRQW